MKASNFLSLVVATVIAAVLSSFSVSAQACATKPKSSNTKAAAAAAKNQSKAWDAYKKSRKARKESSGLALRGTTAEPRVVRVHKQVEQVD